MTNSMGPMRSYGLLAIALFGTLAGRSSGAEEEKAFGHRYTKSDFH